MALTATLTALAALVLAAPIAVGGLIAGSRWGVVIVGVLLAFATTGYFAGSMLALSTVLGHAAAGWRDP